MLLDILTPEKKLFEGDVKSVKFPGTNGEFEILNNHAPIISTLTKSRPLWIPIVVPTISGRIYILLE